MCRYGRPEILQFVLRHATLDVVLLTTETLWLGCHSAASSASKFLKAPLGPDPVKMAAHVGSLNAWVSRMEELIPDESLRHTGFVAMGAYDLMSHNFKAPAMNILQQVTYISKSVRFKGPTCMGLMCAWHFSWSAQATYVLRMTPF